MDSGFEQCKAGVISIAVSTQDEPHFESCVSCQYLVVCVNPELYSGLPVDLLLENQRSNCSRVTQIGSIALVSDQHRRASRSVVYGERVAMGIIRVNRLLVLELK